MPWKDSLRLMFNAYGTHADACSFLRERFIGIWKYLFNSIKLHIKYILGLLYYDVLQYIWHHPIWFSAVSMDTLSIIKYRNLATGKRRENKEEIICSSRECSTWSPFALLGKRRLPTRSRDVTCYGREGENAQRRGNNSSDRTPLRR